jgi:L,D-transpeptidase catalytic domain
VCGDNVRITSELSTAKGADPPPTADGLPRDYYFVGKDGALGYKDLAAAEQTAPAGELQSGFAVSILRADTGPRGDPFGFTTKGLWLPLRDLGRVKPLVFEGYDVVAGQLDRGWVVADTAPILAAAGGKRQAGSKKHRFDRVQVLETRELHDGTFLRIADGQWLDAHDVRVPALSPPPEDARPGERWIDVDVASDVLVLYEGKEPVFTTLVSTGIGKDGAPTATPLGVHRIWVKLRTTDMTNLEEPEAEHYYAMEEVPWVLFFQKGFGLHGAFWHRSFGHPRSHGCVNLTPLDARRLFEWTSPVLPVGWTAVLPTDYDPGTLVRVR